MQNDNALQLFLGDRNLRTEENFCRTFSESRVMLQFNHDNSPRTDGKTIYNDPQFLEIYSNNILLQIVEKHLGIPEKLSSSTWNVLKMVTRALSIHECLHLLYTDFSLNIPNDVKCRCSKNKTFVMVQIWNIIEDAFIEAYGSSVHDNIIGYLKFIRMATALVPSSSNSNSYESTNYKNISDYIDYMCWFLLFSPYSQEENKNTEIQPYINTTKDLFLQGSIQRTPKKRYEYARKIFDIILPLIPLDNDVDLSASPLANHLKNRIISTSKQTFQNNPKNVGAGQIKRRLFTDLNGQPIDDKEQTSTQLLLDLIDFEEDKTRAANESDKPKIETVIISPSNYNQQNIFLHKNIKIIQNRKTTDFAFKDIYDEEYNLNISVINTYKSRIFDLLQAKTEVITPKQIFGHGISSKHFGDVKKRYWYKKEQGIDLPQLSFLFLLDGSGSMSGAKIATTKTASLIIHEVLQANGIEHCFVEHRAGGSQPEITVNVLFDFNAQPSQKYNLMSMCTSGDNRDSLALIWAEKYIDTYATNVEKVIIVLSDGVPAHHYDHYYPPASIEDTALTVNRITHHGTKIAAIALCNTYNDLRAIYPNLVACDNLSTLPAQLFRLIAKMLE